MIQHRPTNDLNLGSCNRYRSKPLSNCNARSQIGTARHELVETPVGRHRSIRRPVHVRSSQNVLPVDSRSADQRRRTWPSSRQAGRPGRSYSVQSPSCPERAGERGGDDTAHASAPLRFGFPAARRRATRSHAGTPSHWGSSTSLPGHAPRAASDPGTASPSRRLQRAVLARFRD